MRELHFLSNKHRTNRRNDEQRQNNRELQLFLQCLSEKRIAPAISARGLHASRDITRRIFYSVLSRSISYAKRRLPLSIPLPLLEQARSRGLVVTQFSKRVLIERAHVPDSGPHNAPPPPSPRRRLSKLFRGEHACYFTLHVIGTISCCTKYTCTVS